MDLLRVVTLNLWNDRERPARRLEVIAEGLRELGPDLVCLQEVREGSLISQGSSLGRMLGMFFAFGLVDSQSAGGPMGNGVLSRYPIQSAENLPLPSAPDDPRFALKVTVRTDAGPVLMTSVHLSWEPHLAQRRERQVLSLDEITRAPWDAHVIVAGDLNSAPESRAVRFLCGLDSIDERGTYFRDAWARRHPHEDGFTWSSRNPYAVRRIELNRRIDYILVRGPVTEREAHTIEGAKVVLDSPAADGTWPSDHFGVLAVVRLNGPPP
jgi:endonuclease/exonuclease/phosphatase family metal-dependent hydrolase